jgi:hypothetical protein
MRMGAWAGTWLPRSLLSILIGSVEEVLEKPLGWGRGDFAVVGVLGERLVRFL